jgi:hypothetical protein
MNANTKPPIRPVLASGSVTRSSVCQGRAPRSAAADSSAGSVRSIAM